MPRSWTESLPVHDQKWVSRAMFVVNARGKPVLRDILQLWWYPPQPALVYTQPPASVDPFYARPFFLWMPKSMWRVVLTCTQPKCHNKQLTACGLLRPFVACLTSPATSTWVQSIWSVGRATRIMWRGATRC